MPILTYQAIHDGSFTLFWTGHPGTNFGVEGQILALGNNKFLDCEPGNYDYKKQNYRLKLFYYYFLCCSADRGYLSRNLVVNGEEVVVGDGEENGECGEDNFLSLNGCVKPALLELNMVRLCRLFCWWMGVPDFFTIFRPCVSRFTK